MMRVPFVDLVAQYRPIREEILAAIGGVLDRMDLVLGPNVRAFEEELAAYCGTRDAVGVNSGTDALYLALRACGVGPGDEVITAANSFIATVEAIALLGATPVLVDVDPETYTLDPARLEEAITPKTRAVVPVHLYGQMADLAAIEKIARRHGLAIIEDACQAHGAEDRGWRAGSVGDAAAFSFYASKNLGGYGDAGAITTNSPEIAWRARMLRDHGSSRKYQHEEMGVNSRLDEIQAAVLRVKLRYLDEWNERRRGHADAYMRALAGLDVVRPSVRVGASHVYHLFVIQMDERDQVREQLTIRGIATGIHYPIPIHQQVASRGIMAATAQFPVTDFQAGRILSLPMFPELTGEQIAYVVEGLGDALAGRRIVEPVAVASRATRSALAQ